MEADLQTVIFHWLNGEIINLIKVWLSVYISLCYCYTISKIIPKGIARFSLLLPVILLFFLLPLNLHTIHLGITSAFFIAWLSNFKLLLLAFNQGPLSQPSVSSSLPRFLAVASLPIKIDQNRTSIKEGHPSISNYAIKGLLLGSMIKLYDYSDHINKNIIFTLYGFHIYFFLEIILAIAASLARAILGVELEPTFQEPLLATSLQDFWGQRWNIMVNRILRPAVYDPVLNWSRKWAPLPATMSTFLVSGLMHELILYYMGRRRPTWNTTWFFLLHGASVAAEMAAKKALKGRWQLPKVVRRVLVVGFFTVTGVWLFLPDMLQLEADVRAFQEYAAVGAFVKDVAHALTMSPSAANITTA